MLAATLLAPNSQAYLKPRPRVITAGRSRARGSVSTNVETEPARRTGKDGKGFIDRLLTREIAGVPGAQPRRLFRL
jgi:hypothetical protein